MLTTVEGIYMQGKIELTEVPAGVGDTRVLVTFLPEEPPARCPQALYGAWQDRFPANLDLDAVLNEIRGEWQLEAEESGVD
ncbi:MAG TPA: hypothetical protein VFB21_23515 [Chthonomonadaceae bacterium]|nr:hypothetical protein [Chthonomonadaceae bacterium]